MRDPLIDNDFIICPVCCRVAEDPVMADIGPLTGTETFELVCRGCRDDYLADFEYS